MNQAFTNSVFAGVGANRQAQRAAIVLFVSLTTTNVAHAISIDLPANIKMTGAAILDAQYDDNIFLALDDAQSDLITRVSPRVEFEREGEVTSLSSRFTLTKGYYQNGLRRDFKDYDANLEWRWRPASLLEIRTSVNYLDVAQSIAGSTDGGLAPILIEVERTRRPAADISFVVGRQGGRLQSVIRSGFRKDEFEDPAREFTTKVSSISANYSVNQPLTIGLQVSETELDFVDSALIPERDNRQRLILATGEYRLPKTRLQVRAGRLNREYDLRERDSFTGPRWDVTLSWSPKSYSTLSITSGKNVQESVGVADFVDVESKIFSWSHSWTDSLSSSLSYSQAIGEFVGAERSDEVSRSNLSVQYQPLDWISFRLGASWLENDSSITSDNLENNRYFFAVEAPL